MKLLNEFNSEKKVIAGNFLSLVILQIANYVIPLIILPFLVRKLGTGNFGLVIFAQSLMTFYIVFVDFGFDISGTRRISISKSDKSRLSDIFINILFAKIFLLVFGLMSLIILVEFIPKLNEDSTVYYYSFGVVIGQAIFPTWFFQGIERMGIITVFNILAKTIFAILIFLLINDESDYLLVPILNSFGFVISGLFGLVFSARYIKIVKPNLNSILFHLKESFSLFIAKFSTLFYTSSNIFILGLFASNEVVGIYGSIEKLIVAVKNGYSPLYQAIFPWLSKQNNKRNSTNRLFPLILTSSLIIAIILFVFSEEILELIYGDVLIVRNAYILQILSFVVVLSATNMLITSLYFPARRLYNLRMKIFAICGVISLFSSLILVYKFSVTGLSISFTLIEFLILIMAGRYYLNENIIENE
ncbi:flippase [Urechidicola sp. KH5]